MKPTKTTVNQVRTITLHGGAGKVLTVGACKIGVQIEQLVLSRRWLVYPVKLSPNGWGWIPTRGKHAVFETQKSAIAAGTKALKKNHTRPIVAKRGCK